MRVHHSLATRLERVVAHLALMLLRVWVGLRAARAPVPTGLLTMTPLDARLLVS
jgi:hypothetical protein